MDSSTGRLPVLPEDVELALASMLHVATADVEIQCDLAPAPAAAPTASAPAAAQQAAVQVLVDNTFAELVDTLREHSSEIAHDMKNPLNGVLALSQNVVQVCSAMHGSSHGSKGLSWQAYICVCACVYVCACMCPLACWQGFSSFAFGTLVCGGV